MRVMRSGHFWQFASIASLATETTDGEILVAFWSKHGLRIDMTVPNFKNISLTCSHLRAHAMAVPV